MSQASMRTQPSGVELIVTLIEAIVADNRGDDCGDDCAVPYWLLNGIIASWRKRGEALRPFADNRALTHQDYERARAALKGEP